MRDEGDRCSCGIVVTHGHLATRASWFRASRRPGLRASGRFSREETRIPVWSKSRLSSLSSRRSRGVTSLPLRRHRTHRGMHERWDNSYREPCPTFGAGVRSFTAKTRGKTVFRGGMPFRSVLRDCGGDGATHLQLRKKRDGCIRSAGRPCATRGCLTPP